MAAAAARLLRRSFSLFPRKPLSVSYTSFTASLQRSRLSPSAPATLQLPLPQLLRNHPSPFQSLAFCSAVSAEDSDGDRVAAPELSTLPEEYATRLSSTSSSAEQLDAGIEASSMDDTSSGGEERPAALERESARFQQIQMKKGDWICPQCNFMNFARNFRCLECKTLRIRADGGRSDQPEVKKGDWTCSRCGFMNFFKNTRSLRCLQCKADMPASGSDNVVFKPGDWHCPECRFMNFAKNIHCLQCNAARPLKAGDWHCPKCQFVNFARNSVCRRCQEVCPENIASRMWECPQCKYLNFERNTSCLECKFKRPIDKSGLGLSTEAYGPGKTSPPNRDSLLFDDKLFGGSSEDGAPAVDDKRNCSASDDEICRGT